MYQVVLFIVSNEVECVPVAWLKSETQVQYIGQMAFRFLATLLLMKLPTQHLVTPLQVRLLFDSF